MELLQIYNKYNQKWREISFWAFERNYLLKEKQNQNIHTIKQGKNGYGNM